MAKEAEQVSDWMSKPTSGDIQSVLNVTPTVHGLFMETCRLCPLVPALPGECLDDIVVTPSSKEEYTLRKGTFVTFSVFPMHRNPDFVGGGDPNAVVPERWSSTKTPTELPFLCTFNLGPHTCPGKGLSMLEAHIALLLTASRYEFSFPDTIGGVDFAPKSVVLTPKDEMPLLVRRRRDKNS